MPKANISVTKLEEQLPDLTGKEKADCLIELCKLLIYKAPEKAKNYVTEAEKIYHDLGGNQEMLNQCIYYYGLAFHYQSEYKRSVTFLIDALENSMVNPSELLLAKTYNAIGNSLNWQGFLDTALPYYIKALHIFEKSGYENGIATCINNIGVIHYANKDYDKSLQYHLKAIEIMKQTNQQEKVDNLNNNIGYLHTKLGDFEAALDYFRLAFKTKNQRILALVCNNLTHLYGEMAEYDKALKYGYQSLEIRQTSNDQMGLVTSYSNIAQILKKERRYKEALEYQLRSLHIAEEIDGTNIYLQKNYEYLTELYYELGDIEKIFFYQRCYVAINEQMYEKKKTKALAEMEIKYETDKKLKETEIYRLKNVDLKSTLEELQATQAQLVQTEKMASLGLLTAGIAHEINNPINFISANIEPLRRNIEFMLQLIQMYDKGLDEKEITRFKERIDIDYTIEETFGMINDISEGVNRTQQIVKGLKNFSRHDRDVLQFIDIHECLESTLLLLKMEVIDVELVKNYSDVVKISAFPGKINQVLMNILVNAIQATEGRENRTVRISTRQEKAFVFIEIADNGIGIAEDKLSKIFDPFFTTKDVGKGTGLGLSISFNIIQEHGGTIEVRSLTDEGSYFTISLPIIQKNTLL